MSINKESYNKIASTWDLNRKKSNLNPYIIKFANLVKKGHILDVGCGAGEPVSSYLSKEGFRVTGIDISSEMIKLARLKNIPNVNFLERDFLTFSSNIKYDGIIAYDSLFHIDISKQDYIYYNLRKLIKPGGFIMFTHGMNYGEVSSKMYDEEFYYSALDLKEIKSLLKDNNFEIVDLVKNYQDKNDSRDLILIARNNKK